MIAPASGVGDLYFCVPLHADELILWLPHCCLHADEQMEGCGWISWAVPVNGFFLTCRKVLVGQRLVLG